MNVCNRAAAVLERISNKYTVKASVSGTGQRGSFVLTVSRCDTVAILSSRQTSMVGFFFAAPLLSPHLTCSSRDSTCTHASASDDNSAAHLSVFQTGGTRPADWQGRRPSETHWCFTSVACRFPLSCGGGAGCDLSKPLQWPGCLVVKTKYELMESEIDATIYK